MVLLEAGADPNIETYADQGIPLAMIGGIPDRLDVLKAMLDKGADVHHPVKNANMSLLDFMKTYFSDDQSLKPVIALMEQYAWFAIARDSFPPQYRAIWQEAVWKPEIRFRRPFTCQTLCIPYYFR